MSRLIDADALERDGWMMHRTVQVDKNTMSYQVKKPTDFHVIETERNRKWSNKDWIDFLSEMFEVSRTSARDMLHVMMQVKKEDNFKKQFSGIRRQNESSILSK